MKLLSILFSSLILLSIAGCQTVPSQPKLSTVSEAETKVPENTGQLFIFRDGALAQRQSPPIFINRAQFGKCQYNYYTKFNLPPGSYKVTVGYKPHSESIDVLIKNGKITIAKCGVWRNIFENSENFVEENNTDKAVSSLQSLNELGEYTISTP